MIGSTVSHYRILAKLGEGGMGIVYKAEDTSLNRTVALKFLSPHAILSEDDKTRFVREARAAATLNHPNVATIFEFGEADDPVSGRKMSFIAMEYVDGQALSQKIAERPVAVPEAVTIAITVAEALSKAHEKGIVHRDIKPENIMISADGVVKVMDFGLADVAGRTKVTREGTLVGTVAYMSPEQARGERVDRRSDLWSFGIVLYEMLAGKKPFLGTYEQALVYQILNEEPEPITSVRSNVPMDLERIITKLIQKIPDHRYQSAADVLVDLRSLIKNIGSGVRQPPPATSGPHQRQRSSLYRLGLVGSMMLLLLAAVSLYYFQSTTSNAKIRSIAVLPFANLSEQPDQEYFADGITEDIITQLSKIADLKVISRTSVMQFKGTNKGIREIGRELDVAAVLEGSIRRTGNQIRIVAQLIDANHEGHLWAETYDKELTQIFAIQSDVAQNIASALKARLLPEEKARIGSTHAENTEAYEYYLRGRFYWNKRTAADIQTAIGYFQKAIAVDTSFALAYTGLASAYATLPQYGLRGDKYWLLATALAKQGLELDSESAEAHAVLGLCKKNYEWDWAGAESQLKQAIVLNPGYATAHHWYCIYLTSVGKLDEAMSEIVIAQGLDPLSLVINSSVAWSFYISRQYDKAVEGAKKTLELDSNYLDARILLGLVYGRVNRFDEAIAVLTKVRHTAGDTPRGLPELGQTYVRAGTKKEALETLDSLFTFSKRGYSVSWGIASIYCALGDNDSTFHWLEKAYQDREVRIGVVKVDPIWDNIRSDPRFLEFMKKMGLEK